jgi:virulence-associated protein VapD
MKENYFQKQNKKFVFLLKRGGNFMSMKVVTTRLPAKKIKIIEAIAKKEFLDRSSIVRKLTLKSLDDYLYNNYISKYKQGKISISQLSKELGIDLWTLTDYLKEKNIEQDINYQELKENEKNFNKICKSVKEIKYNLNSKRSKSTKTNKRSKNK